MDGKKIRLRCEICGRFAKDQDIDLDLTKGRLIHKRGKGCKKFHSILEIDRIRHTSKPKPWE